MRDYRGAVVEARPAPWHVRIRCAILGHKWRRLFSGTPLVWLQCTRTGCLGEYEQPPWPKPPPPSSAASMGDDLDDKPPVV